MGGERKKDERPKETFRQAHSGLARKQEKPAGQENRLAVSDLPKSLFNWTDERTCKIIMFCRKIHKWFLHVVVLIKHLSF